MLQRFRQIIAFLSNLEAFLEHWKTHHQSAKGGSSVTIDHTSMGHHLFPYAYTAQFLSQTSTPLKKKQMHSFWQHQLNRKRYSLNNTSWAPARHQLLPNLERLVSNFSIKLPDRAFDPLGKIKLIVKFIHVSRRKSLDRKFRPASISFRRLSCLTLEVRLERGHFPGKQPTYPSFHLLFVKSFKFSLTRLGRDE